MFMPTVAALGVFSAWVTIKYHTSIQNLKRVLFQILFAAILLNILKICQQHAE